MQTKVFNKGQVVIPTALRKKYGFEVGKEVEIINEKDGIKIIPIKGKQGIEELQGIFSKHAKGKVLTRGKIERATEKRLMEGYE